MGDLLSSSLFIGVAISLFTYWVGMLLKKRFQSPVFNPLLISVVLTIIILTAFNVEYNDYNKGAKHLSHLLTPSTVCLAIPLYQQLEILKKNWKAIILSIAAGTLASLLSILLLAISFSLTHEQYITLLPKSVVAVIAVGISDTLGGMTTIVATAVVITGIVGNAIVELVLKLARIEDPIAKGLARGTAMPVIGASDVTEFCDVEGAMNSLSIGVAGVMTALAASFFANLY